MTEDEARQRLSEWEPRVEKMNFTDGTSFTDYHINRIKREQSGSWDDNHANQYIIGLISELESKYGDEQKTL